jgi:translin
MTYRINEVVNEIDSFLKVKDEAREQIIKITRDVIREAGYAVTEANADNMAAARNHLARAQEKWREVSVIIARHEELRHSGIIYNAGMELAEAAIFISIVEDSPIPGPEDIGVHRIPYLLGLLDVVGELRRYAIAKVRENNFKEAWRAFYAAESIFLSTKSLDYPDKLVPGLRRKIDAARYSVEELRKFLTDMESRVRLINKLSELSEQLEKLS